MPRGFSFDWLHPECKLNERRCLIPLSPQEVVKNLNKPTCLLTVALRSRSPRRFRVRDQATRAPEPPKLYTVPTQLRLLAAVPSFSENVKPGQKGKHPFRTAQHESLHLFSMMLGDEDSLEEDELQDGGRQRYDLISEQIRIQFPKEALRL